MLTIEKFLAQTHEDILNWTISVIKQRNIKSVQFVHANHYNVDFCELLSAFINSNGGAIFQPHEKTAIEDKLSQIFLDVAWELCTKRVLRPNPYQLTRGGSSQTNNFYSLTQPGIEWLRNRNQIEIFLSPTRLEGLFFEFKGQFGDTFYLRAKEAVNCYHSDVYLACCVMCGAAAEAIFLRIAIVKFNGTKDEEQIIKKYCSTGGRKKIEDEIFGQQKKDIKEEIQPGLSLIKYWRDASGHASETTIKEIHAYNSLQSLLQLSTFVRQRYDDLIK